jgi:hypothetical protein
MAYVKIPDAWIVAGKPTREDIFQYIQDNQESFNADIESLKQTSQFDIIDVKIAGQIVDYTEPEIQSRMPVYKAPVSGTITSVVLTLLTASTSGTLQVDIEKSTDNGVNWATLLTSPVEITGTSVGSISGAVNFINAAAQNFNQNDLIRISIPGVQVNQGEFHVSIYGELGA